MPFQSLLSAIETLKGKIDSLKKQPSGVSDRLLQLSQDVDAIPLISWLASQQTYPRIYWQGRDKVEEVAAIGQCLGFYFEQDVSDQQLAAVYQRQRQLSDNPQFRYYGGLAFDRSLKSWPEFGQARFVLPRVELRRSAEHFSLKLNINLDAANLENELAEALQCLQQIKPARPLMPPHKLALRSRHDLPTFERWQSLVTQVTAPDFNQATPKVVLSRITQLDIHGQADPWMVLACWQGRNPNSFQFGFQFSPEHAFISCSPERLFRRRQRELFTEALAGTTLRGLSDEEDEVLARALLDDDKNKYENQLVREHIVDMLNPLSHYVGADELPRVFKLTHIQHLHRAIRAELKGEINDFDLLQALHPTPAVGGLPRQAAMSFIRDQEGYHRGWYAGACGYFNSLESEFAVAIRSALFEPNRINLFAGAGIVAGSDPHAEWQELENKLATIISILIDF
ncbi:isochorismate synthase MenF [Shewanella sp. NIFS-20-20]|uniref:isochorismate synthase n=1 Tax=Shewanella sp. NIFS-20-20 TaxID=2853806 RepID=UPI001C44D78C|nr:isochorismate synthase [Shewanella sp. NIFS-20-20]MBV7316035.1 isochorismate synthase [Shewanella sp. NIFS-20-20]